MKLRHISALLAFFLAGFVFLTQQVNAQSETVLVPWETSFGSNEVDVNALRDSIVANPDRIFKLQWGGFYQNSDPIENQAGHPLTIIGETFEESTYPGKEESWGPAIIQRYTNSEGNAPGQMFNAYDDLTLINVWLMGQTTAGVRTAYEPMKLLGDGKRYTFDKVIFDRHDWHHLGPDAANVKFYVTNCRFRNLFGPTQQWEGLAVRFEAGADTVVFENNTFLNIGFTPFQSEAAPINYFRCNHNTFVNVGRSFSAGSLWRTVYVANNVFVNNWWHGEDESQYSNPSRVDPYAGFFSIAAIDPSYGLNDGREILVTKNSYWRDSRFQTFYDNYVPVIRAQPFINDTTQRWFDAYPNNMKIMNNYIGENPGLTTYPLDQPGLFDSMTAHISYYYEGGSTSAPRYYWDPNRNESSYINSIWPLGEDFSYSNATLQTAGTDGLPLGDLNWYSTAKATWETNKETYIKQIEDIITPPVITVDSLYEAETTILSGDAIVDTVKGFTFFQMDGGGWFQWDFNLDVAGQYDLNVLTHMRNNDTRGQHTRINGIAIHDSAFGYGELIYSTNAAPEGSLVPNPHQGMPINEWTWVLWTADMLKMVDRPALTMPAGHNTIRINPSWGYQNFSQIDILQPGTANVVTSLLAPAASYSGVIPSGHDSIPWVPSAFKSVNLGAGGGISFDVNAAEAGEYLFRMFYAANGSVSVQIEIDNQVVLSNVTCTDTGDVVTGRFNLAAGQHAVKISSAQGGVKLDYVLFMSYSVVSGITELSEIPNGYSLAQNYPNPFNPKTNINFSIAKASDVKLAIFDILGQKVATIINQYMNAGSYSVDFNASHLASGVYIYRLEAGDFKVNKKMMLLK